MRCGQVGVVEGILASIVTTNIAFSTHAAGITRAAMNVGMLLADRLTCHRSFVLIMKSNGEIREEPVHVQLLSSFLKLYYFGSLVIRGLVERILLGVHHLLDAV